MSQYRAFGVTVRMEVYLQSSRIWSAGNIIPPQALHQLSNCKLPIRRDWFLHEIIVGIAMLLMTELAGFCWWSLARLPVAARLSETIQCYANFASKYFIIVGQYFSFSLTDPTQRFRGSYIEETLFNSKHHVRISWNLYSPLKAETVNTFSVPILGVEVDVTQWISTRLHV